MRRIAVCAPSISPNSLMKLSALTFSAMTICVWPVSRLMAPWMLSRSRPVVCSTAIATSLRAQQPAGLT
jgi:hypothetical protein